MTGQPPITQGSDVVVRTFGGKRGVVVAVGRDGRCQVRVGRVTMWCRQEDLALPVERKHTRDRRGAARGAPDEHLREAAPAGRIDLHGLTVDEAMARVVDEIDRSLRRGADRLEIVHGKGSGRIRHELHRRLSAVTIVKAFRLDPSNQGVTWVFFG